jgi:hypothetical protein
MALETVTKVWLPPARAAGKSRIEGAACFYISRPAAAPVAGKLLSGRQFNLFLGGCGEDFILSA